MNDDELSQKADMKMDNEKMTEEKKKYTGRGGYHGGGRKPTGIKRASIAVSGQPEELEQLKANAEAAGYATTSKFIIDMLVHKYPGITSQHSEDAE